MADKFEEVAGHLVRVGARQFSALAIIEEAIKPFLPAGPDDRLRAAVSADARESFVRLQQRVDAIEAQLQAQGRALDDLGAKRTVAIAQEIATSIAGAYGELKIDAVLNAAARQFDPRMGPQEVRKFWLDRATKLEDLQVRVLMLLVQHAPLYYFPLSGELYWGPSRDTATLPDEDRVALGSVLEDMHTAGELVTNDGTNASFPRGVGSTSGRVLSRRGKVLVRFIEQIQTESG